MLRIREKYYWCDVIFADLISCEAQGYELPHVVMFVWPCNISLAAFCYKPTGWEEFQRTL